MKSQIPSIAFYEFHLNPYEPDRGGTGIEFESLTNFLKAQKDHSTVRCIPCVPNQTVAKILNQKFQAFLVNQWQDLRRLLGTNEDFLLLVYPKIPFVGHSNDVRVLTLAMISYGLMAIKTFLLKQRVVVLITDLPVEQSLMVEPVKSEVELKQKLTNFYNWSQFSWPDRLLMHLERLLFKRADLIVSLSRLMTDHIVQKHNLSRKKICLRGRNSFTPGYNKEVSSFQLTPTTGLRVFYSGDLARENTRANLKKIIQVFQQFPAAQFYLCGQDGEWVNREIEAKQLKNVYYLGALDFAIHDAVARQCDVGLLLYTFAYAHLVLTSKYSAYVANGLAVLSTDLVTLSEVIKQDCVGLAIPLEKFPTQLEQWLAEPERVKPFKNNAMHLSKQFSQGSYMQKWFSRMLDFASQFNNSL